MSKCDENDNYFVNDVYRGESNGVDTRFYIVNCTFFKDNLLDCYQKILQKTNKEFPLEEIFFVLLKGRYKCLKHYPKFNGISAGNGRDYSKEPPIFQYLFFDIMAQMGIFNKLFYLVRLTMRIRYKMLYLKKKVGLL